MNKVLDANKILFWATAPAINKNKEQEEASKYYLDLVKIGSFI